MRAASRQSKWPAPRRPARARIARSTKRRSSERILSKQLRQKHAELFVTYGTLRRKHLELELSRERYAFLYNHSPIGYLCLEATGIVREINLEAAKLLGNSPVRLLNAPFATHVVRADLGRFLDHLRCCRERRGQVVSEMRLQRRDGAEIHIQLLSRSIPSALWHGEMVIHTAIADLSERRSLESSMRRNEAWLQLALDAAHAGAWELDLITGAGIWSDEFCRLLGRSPGLTFPSYETLLSSIHPADLAEAKRAIDRSLRGETNLRVEFRAQLNGDCIRWLSMVGRVSQYSTGSPSVLSGIGIDITERKQAEEWLRKSSQTLEHQVQERTAELQAANVELERQISQRLKLERQILEVGERERRRIGQDLHDGLGQQLTGIRFYASALQEKLARKSLPEAADAQHLASLLQDAKAQTRKLARGLLPVPSIPDGLMAALRLLAEHVSELHGIACRFDCPRPVLLADDIVATHLFRIAQEAVSNAIEHARTRKITVALSANNGSIQLQVQNDQHARQRNHNSRLGLGLQIMKSRSEAMGGVIEVRTVGLNNVIVNCSVPVPKKRMGGN